MQFNGREIFPGDEVTVRAKVVGTGNYGAEVRIQKGILCWLENDAIATHTPAPRPIKVGDRVTYKDGIRLQYKVLDESGRFMELADERGDSRIVLKDGFVLAPDTAESRKIDLAAGAKAR